MTRVDYILERVHGRVLHVGASTGPLHEVVRARSDRLFGMDVESREGDDDVHQGDVQDPSHPIFQEHFDVILLGEVVEHLMDPAQALRNCASCCDRIVITTPNPRALTMRWRGSGSHPLLDAAFDAKLLIIRETEGPVSPRGTGPLSCRFPGPAFAKSGTIVGSARFRSSRFRAHPSRRDPSSRF